MCYPAEPRVYLCCRLRDVTVCECVRWFKGLETWLCVSGVAVFANINWRLVNMPVFLSLLFCCSWNEDTVLLTYGAHSFTPGKHSPLPVLVSWPPCVYWYFYSFTNNSPIYTLQWLCFSIRLGFSSQETWVCLICKFW